jgi:HK97 family phage portal protein
LFDGLVDLPFALPTAVAGISLTALLTGNGYAEISFDMANRPGALCPLMPDSVDPKRNSETGALEYHVRDASGLVEVLPASRVLHIHGLGFDGLRGYSVIHMAAKSIGIGLAQDVFGQAFFQNGTVMGAVLEVGAAMSPTQIQQMEDAMNTRHMGPGAAFKVKVAPQGTKVHNPTMPMTDAQFLESRKFSITEVCRWYGVPPHKVQDLDRSTNNNIEHQGIEFVQDAIVPWAVRLEQEANVKLFGDRAQGRVYTKFTVNALMRGDSKSRAEFYRLMTQMGAMTINEVRAMEDMNSIGPDGDELLVQLNQTTLQRLVEGPPETTTLAAEPQDEDLAPEQPTNVYDLSDGVRGNPMRLDRLEFTRKKA